MGENSHIEWTHHTFNPWVGCSKVSPACKNCYAEGWAKRSGLVQWGDGAERRRTSESNWRQPLKWNKEAKQAGERRRVFCASLADVCEDREELEPWREDLFELIAETTNLDWLLLTKRPENFERVLPWTHDHLGEYRERYWPHVWIGTTVENQEMADKRIPELLKIPAAVRFLSCEPLLGPVNLRAIYRPKDGGVWDSLKAIDTKHACHLVGKIDWVIVGGESGPNARPMRPDWARSLRDQCKAAGVPVFFKQWGVWVPDCRGWVNENINGHLAEFRALVGKGKLNRHHWPDGTQSHLFSKKTAGRLLDGIEHSEFPTINTGD